MMEIQNLIRLNNGLVSNFESDIKALEFHAQQIEATQKTIKQLSDDVILYEEVRVFLQELAEVTRGEIASGLERVVTLCLQAVFGEDLRFEIEISTTRNSTAVHFFVVDSSGKEDVRFSPEESMGGGVVDTVAIGLRFGLLKILNPEPVGPIILDEPAKMVSSDLMESIAALLQELTQMFDKQTILVTHHTSIMDTVDQSIYFSKTSGVTKATS